MAVSIHVSKRLCAAPGVFTLTAEGVEDQGEVDAGREEGVRLVDAGAPAVARAAGSARGRRRPDVLTALSLPLIIVRVMRNMPAHAHRLVAVLVIVGAVSLAAMLPGLVTGQQSDEDVDLKVTLDSSKGGAFPGGIIEFQATIENQAERQLTGLTVAKTHTEAPSALVYVQQTTLLRFEDDGPERQFPPLDKEPVLVSPTVGIDQTIQLRWQMRVAKCAVRHRWSTVWVHVRTNEIEALPAYADVHILPHSALALEQFRATYKVDRLTPSAGESVRHTVTIVNDGFARLDDVLVRVGQQDTVDRFLPTVADDDSWDVINRRGGKHVHMVPDPRWPRTGFRLDLLGSGQILVLSWTDYVAADAPVGTVITPSVSMSAVGHISSQRWEVPHYERRLVVVPRNKDLEFHVRIVDPSRLSTSYFPGEVVPVQVTLTNSSDVAYAHLRVTLDLPFALSYVDGSGRRTTPSHMAGNARRLPDKWISDGALLSSLEPGESTSVAFNLMVREDAAPQRDIEIEATVHTEDRSERYDAASLDISAEPDLSITVRDLELADPGEQVLYDIRVENTGQTTLTDVRFGVEETCDVEILWDSLEIYEPTPYGQANALVPSRRDDSTEDSTFLLDALEPQEWNRIRFMVRIPNDAPAGPLVGVGLVAVAGVSEPTIVRAVRTRKETELTVVEPFVTAAEFREAVTDILAKIRATTEETSTTAERTEDLAEEIEDITTATDATATELEKTTGAIEKQADEITAISENTKDLATDINEKVEDVLAQVVEDANPWDQSFGWILSWGSFGLLASFLAGLLLAFPAWETLKWVWRKWGTGLWLALYEAAPSGGRSPTATATSSLKGRIAASAGELKRWVGDKMRRRPPDGDKGT